MSKEFDLSLYLVTDRRTFNKNPLIEVVKQALDGGVTIVQLREKHVPIKEVIRFGRELHKLTRRYRVPLIINDNIIAALAIDAEGVHVGQNDQIAFSAREMIGPDKILGVSAGTVSEAIRAQQDGADYLGVGPIFPTKTKEDARNPIGIATLEQICAAVTIPVVAIGGITQETTQSIIHAGAYGIAVVSAIVAQPNPQEAAKNLKTIILSARQ